MNFPAIYRNLFPRRAGRATSTPRRSLIEPLEARIAPASLISPTTVTYLDKNGDIVTVTISKHLFTTANINQVFTFDTGSVNGSNSTQQQLQTLNIDALGKAAAGMDITVTLPSLNNGTADIGYINASAINLGNVTVPGDLGRIAAGNLSPATPALLSLTVGSIGAQGTATQGTGGNLVSLLAGAVHNITVNGDIDNADIGIGGGKHGLLGSLTVTGSINGGAVDNSGSIRTQGGITTVQIDGSINGGGGMDSGVVGTAGMLGTVVVEGCVVGGGGTFSGAILSTLGTTSVHIEGNLKGGAGPNSGQVGTAGNLGSVTVDGSVTGGTGLLSGTILSTGNISSVTIGYGLFGSSGQNSGEIGASRNIGSVTIGPSQTVMTALVTTDEPAKGEFGIIVGTGIGSGSINALGTIGNITVNGFIEGPGVQIAAIATPATEPANVWPSISAGGNIASLTVCATVDGAQIVSGGSIGPVLIGDSLTENSVIHAAQNIASVTVGQGVGSSSALLVSASESSSGNPGISDSAIIADKGTIGFISATADFGYNAIENSIIQAGGSIGYISAAITCGSDRGDNISTDNESDSFAIYNTGIDAGQSIGAISATNGSIDSSVFIAGIDLGTAFQVVVPGTFSTCVAQNLGFGSSTSSINSHIGNITLTGNTDGTFLIESSTFLAGVHGAGVDKTFGTVDDFVARGSFVGNISTPGGLENVYVESGSIGATHSSGAISNTDYLATDTSITAGGIGNIIVCATTGQTINIPTDNAIGTNIEFANASAIANSSFISNGGIGNITVTLTGERACQDNSGISDSTFQAGHAIGTVSATNNSYGSSGSAYGIESTTFNAGIDRFGGIGDISATLTDAGNNGQTAAIIGSSFDASLYPNAITTMGGIFVENAGSNSGAAGIVDSTFRVYGNMGPITAWIDNESNTAPAIMGSTFSAYGNIGDIYVIGSVSADSHGPSRFLAGYDIGTDMTFGNENLGTQSQALHAGQSIGNVSVSGYFTGSDMIASVNPGAGYVFGDSIDPGSAQGDTNVGAGGSIGAVTIGSGIFHVPNPLQSDSNVSHGIEAAVFNSNPSNPTVSLYNFTDNIPGVLFVDGGSGDVRITNLTEVVT